MEMELEAFIEEVCNDFMTSSTLKAPIDLEILEAYKNDEERLW